MQTPAAPSFHIRPLLAEDAPALEAMYRHFEPRGSAMGLPPIRDERTHDWLDHLGASARNLLAFSGGRIVGHAILADSREGEAELAVFVHQDYRGVGIGTALGQAAVEQARKLGYRRLWAAGSADNAPSIRMMMKCGLRRRAAPGDEMELDL